MPAFEAYRPMLLAYAQHQLAGTGLDADDFVQDAMERGLRVFVNRRPPKRVDAWLIKVLQNLLVSDFRKRCVRQRAENDPTLQLEPIPQPDELDPVPVTKMAAILEELTDEEFADAVESLGPKLRDAYELHIQGLSNPQIAGQLDITGNAVAKRLFDARRQLRKLLGRAAKEYES